ncbi:MAG: hypothetical protein GPJ05_14385 [Microcystis aeruginosa G13-10]|nr:hypothetical protein [Microcystis aeruginosa G13-10]
MNIGKQLEQYTLKNPQEVLLVTIAVDGEEEEISIFKGFSSSLTRSTLNPRYIQENLTLEEMQSLLIN